MCECRKRIETAVAEQVAAQLPEGAQQLRVSLNGYAMVFSGPVSSKQYLVAEITYQAPTKGSKAKASVMRERKDAVNIMASHCMFCGEKYPVEEPKPAAPVSAEVPHG